MHLLSSPIQYIKIRNANKTRTRTALSLLALSGVVRPSHIEIRYATSITTITALRKQPTAISHPQTQFIPVQSEDRTATFTFNMKQTQQWMHSFSSAIVQLTKKPIAHR